ncbi:hypothetical protein FB45DRAFT_1056829 [Roridomyces roridus]|uniref:Uncharacterized protein n=1 Tax=Roridomyces roridus TaxID=1738132 RepID=A0AAD7BZI4_9AGAR|nr:hypothetical protein FB45DRAFT_1056829 [Roridomyces roridus]
MAFTVYCDPDADTPTVVKPTANVLSSSLIDSNLDTSSSTSLASSAEKENLHPITGERCGGALGDASASKKRKTNVLATKTIVAKKQKEDKAEGKKPRSASSKGRKDGKASKKAAKRPLRRVSPLPKVDEDVAERDRLVQADIDSRCYELTVSPLADVTDAYDAGIEINSLLTSFTSEETAKFRKATSTEPELRDYFSPKHCSGRVTPPASAASANAPKVFNTPERRQIYSAFTFTTPSPSSERFRKANSRSPSPTIPPLNLSPSATTSTASA